ncbi:MAG: aromatic amino acid lyase, partial [Flavitalea sp.]
MIQVGGKALTLQDFSDIVFSNRGVSLDTAAVQKVSANHAFLRQFSSHKLIYGINTGFGPMAQFKVSD